MPKDELQFLCPNEGKLITEGETVTSEIMDAELDVIKVSFDYSNTALLDTSGLEWIVLTPHNLRTLSRLIRKSERYFEQHFAKEDQQLKNNENNQSAT